MTFHEWKHEVDQLLKSDYGINTEEAGVDDDRLKSHWSEPQPPQAFVEWFATKYDLWRLSDAVWTGVSG
jgi:hypothetical protein